MNIFDIIEVIGDYEELVFACKNTEELATLETAFKDEVFYKRLNFRETHAIRFLLSDLAIRFLNNKNT